MEGGLPDLMIVHGDHEGELSNPKFVKKDGRTYVQSLYTDNFI